MLCQLTFTWVGYVNGTRGKLGPKGYVAIQDVVEVVGNAVSCNHFEGVKCVHELTMGDLCRPSHGRVYILRRLGVTKVFKMFKSCTS